MRIVFPSRLLAALCFAAVACSEPAPERTAPRTAASTTANDSIAVRDDAGREIRLAAPARRIVSLIPSATETLLALGAAPQLVGRTNYDKADQIAALPSVGGGLDPNLETLVALRPDLVVVWEGKRTAQLGPELARIGIRTFALSADDTADVFRSIGQLGALTGRPRAADSVAALIRDDLDGVARSVRGRPSPSVLFVVWHDPPMTAGPNTFVAQVIGVAGGRTVFPDATQDWPNVSLEEIVRRQPDYLVLPEGEVTGQTVELLRRSPGWRDLRAVREGRIIRVPADLVNRPGPNLGRAAQALRDGLHPGATTR